MKRVVVPNIAVNFRTKKNKKKQHVSGVKKEMNIMGNIRLKNLPHQGNLLIPAQFMSTPHPKNTDIFRCVFHCVIKGGREQW